MADFPRKILYFNPPKYEAISESTEKFEDALDARSDSVSNGEVFLPLMVDDNNEAPTNITVRAENEKAQVYKIKHPGFLYYQHWKGLWDSSGYIRVLVCKDSNFTSNVYELMNTKDTTGKQCEHVNNMFPINPGSSIMYMIVVGTMSADTKQLYFVPAWGVEGGYSAVAVKNDDKTTKRVTVPSVVLSGNLIESDTTLHEIFK